MLTRSRLLALAVVGGLLAGGATWLAQGAEPTKPQANPRMSLWKALSSHVAAEQNPPATVVDAVKRSEAVVVAHVTDVTEGRIQVPHYYDKSIPPEDLPGGGIRTWYVHLTVDRVVKGPMVKGSVVKWETFAAPSPLTPESVTLPSGPILFFLGNLGAGIERAGFAATMDPIERELWGPTSHSRSLVAADSTGLYAVRESHPDPMFIGSFQARTVEQAADRAAQAAAAP